MLRNIQLIAASIAAFFGVVALYDFYALPFAWNNITAPWPGVSSLEMVPGWMLATIAICLAIAPFGALASVARSKRVMGFAHFTALDHCRRITWAVSIIETAGCMVFVMHDSMLFLPSAAALLIVGVAELACILHDVERLPYSATQRIIT